MSDTVKHNTILILALLALTAPAYAQSIAPVTTYVPTVGDRLTFEAIDWGNDKPETIESTIASISSDSKAVRLLEKDSTTTTWVSTPELIKNNFLGVSVSKEVLVISNFTLLTTRVGDPAGTAIWFTLNKDGSTRFPEIIQVTRNGRVIFKITAIVRPNKKAKKQSK